VKRVLVLLVCAVLVGTTSGAADAGKSRRVERTVQGSYGALPTPVTGCNSALGPWACMIVSTRRGEAFFTATVADNHGQPVAADVYSGGRLLGSFCGSTTEAFAVTPGATLEIDIAQGRGSLRLAECPYAVKTTGTITVTLSNQR
jgi:hypothetical protein